MLCFAFRDTLYLALILTSPNFFSWVIKLSHLEAGKEAGKDFDLPPITKHIPIIEHFEIFYSLVNQIKQFLCHWMLKLKGFKCSLSVRSKGATQRTQEEDE
jgi:hypothetical protein